MSRVGKKPIKITGNISIEKTDGSIFVKGPKGELTLKVPEVVNCKKEEDSVSIIVNAGNEKDNNRMQGLYRASLARV
ncbi:50S ribosomal protein L6 [Candidatus Margulisiibacteriota bacterium]